MWAVAADSGELAAALIPAVWTFLGVVVVTLGTIAVQALKSRSERSTAPAPSPATDGAVLIQMAKEQGALVQRADDNDERFEVMDRRLDEVERRLDRSDPDWRS